MLSLVPSCDVSAMLSALLLLVLFVTDLESFEECVFVVDSVVETVLPFAFDVPTLLLSPSFLPFCLLTLVLSPFDVELL